MENSWGMVADKPAKNSITTSNLLTTLAQTKTAPRQAPHQYLPNPSTIDNPPQIHPTPSPPLSQIPTPPISKAQKTRLRNRRAAYLSAHPEYFTNPDLELADPLLHDRLIRRFQSSKEREEEGRRKGYGRVLEGDLWRGEAKLAELAGRQLGADLAGEGERKDRRGGVEDGGDDDAGGEGGRGGEEEDEIPETKEEGLERWKEALTQRFIAGLDADFEYAAVDNDDSLDVLERQEEEDEWFEAESPSWADGDVAVDGKGKGEGETGIQDF